MSLIATQRSDHPSEPSGEYNGKPMGHQHVRRGGTYDVPIDRSHLTHCKVLVRRSAPGTAHSRAVGG